MFGSVQDPVTSADLTLPNSCGKAVTFDKLIKECALPTACGTSLYVGKAPEGLF